MKNKRHYLYRHFDNAGALLYVGISNNPYKRIGDHKRLSDWFDNVANITLESYPTRNAVRWAEQDAIYIEKPIHNIQGISDSRKRAPNNPEIDPSSVSLTLEQSDVIDGFQNEKEAVDFTIQKGIGIVKSPELYAKKIGVSSGIFTKLMRGLVGIPKNRMSHLVAVSESAALLQYFAKEIDCVVVTQEQSDAMDLKIEQTDRRIRSLSAINAFYEKVDFMGRQRDLEDLMQPCFVAGQTPIQLWQAAS